MTKVPLRTRFLTLLLVGVLAVTCATLLLVRHTIESQVRVEISASLGNSVSTFNALQAEHEHNLGRSAELLADLPTVKALMTTQDVTTIQDASLEIWRLSGQDLLVLASPEGKIMAVHAASRDISSINVQDSLERSLRISSSKQWWFVGGHLYEVFFQPIYFGPSTGNRVLGVLALGYEINGQVARDVSRITGSHVAFLYGDSVVAGTIASARWPELVRSFRNAAESHSISAQDLQLGEERYLATSVEVAPGITPRIRLGVLKSYDEATARFQEVYWRLVVLGVLALLGQSLLAFVIFRRFTRPLEQLVAGVRALGKGDFAYPLSVRGKDEVAEVTASFIRMRDDLQQTQRQLLDAEQLATIGRMASSISHDLRHQLTAVVANSEFLSERDLNPQQSEELYQEIRDAVGRMTDLIDSLLEFSKTRDSLSPSFGSVEEIMQRAIRSVQSHPSVHDVNIRLTCQGNSQGWFDFKKLERVFYNLLLNACQAVPPEAGEIEISIQHLPGRLEISISDNGSGIPAHLHDKIFEPFASYGKENGTGLGLTIVHKILEEHGGTIKLTSSSPGQTTFQITIPIDCNVDTNGRDDMSVTTLLPENEV